MSILAVEGSGKYLYLALKVGKKIFSEKYDVNNDLCEQILVRIDSLLRKTEEPLEKILVGNGPGSFTSLRIVFSVVKGLSLGFGVPVYTISVLDLLYYAYKDSAKPTAKLSSESKVIVPVIDAKKHKLYFSFYSNGKKIFPKSDNTFEFIVSKLTDILVNKDIGEDILEKNDIVKNVLFISDDESISNLVTLENIQLIQANLALALIDNENEATSLDKCTGPLYIRLSDAEENLIKKTVVG